MLDEIYWTKYDLVNELVIYTICAKNIKNLPGKMNELTYIFLEGVPVIYVGITKSDMKERCKKHFKGTAQVSTLRKSLGVLLGYRKQYENGKKEYRFVDEDEEKLSKWMGENLIFYYYLLPDMTTAELQELESDLIAKYDPPLNLDKIKNKKQSPNYGFREKLSKLRKP